MAQQTHRSVIQSKRPSGGNGRRVAIALAAAGAVHAFVGSAAEAAAPVWQNIGTDWNTGSNWLGGTGTGGIPGAADDATFSSAAGTSPDVSAPDTLVGINFSTTGSSGYTIGSANGSSLTLTGTGTSATTAAVNNTITAGSNIISANLILGGAAGTTARFNQGTGGTLVLSGNISSTNAIKGVDYEPISNAVSSIFQISGNNTYAGTTTLGFATFNVNSASAFSSGTVIFGNNPRFNNTSGGSVTIANNMTVGTSFTYAGTSAANELVWSGALDFSGGNRTIDTLNAGGRLVFSGAVNWGARQHTKSDGGTLVLNDVGTGTGVATAISGVSYSEGMRINAGIVELGNASALGSGVVDIRAATLSSNANLTGANKVNNQFVIATGTPQIGGSGNLELGGGLIVSNGASTATTLNITNTGTTKISGPVSLTDVATTDNQTLNVNVAATAGAAEISGAIQNSSVASTSVGGFIKSGDGSLLLSGVSTYTGITDVQAGTLQLTGSLSPSTSLNLGNGTNSGRLVLGGASGATSLNVAALSTAGTGTNNAIVGGNSSVSTFTVTSNANTSYAGAIGGSGTNENNLAFTKAGTGTLSLNGTYTHNGATTVAGGKLAITGQLANSNVNVTGGTFDGTGTVRGISIAAGAGNTLATGGGTANGLTADSVSFGGAGQLSLTTSLATLGSSPLTVLGAFSTTGANSLGLNVATTDTSWIAGTYNLLNYGSLGGSGLSALPSSANVNVIGLSARQTRQLVTSTSGLVQLVIAGENPTYTGAVNGIWDTSTNNFILPNAGTPTAFMAGDIVTFDNNAYPTANNTLTIPTNVTTTRVDFVNGTFTINGPGGIVGNGAVNVKAGTNITLASPNGYSGGTNVTDATLNLNSSTAIGTGTLAIAGTGLATLGNTSGSAVTLSTNNAQVWNSDFTYAGPNDLNLGTGAVTTNGTRNITVSGGKLTVGGNITATSTGFSLNKYGTGTLTISGNNGFSGATNIHGGELEIAGGTTGNTASSINIAASPGETASLRVSGGTLNADQILIAGGGNVDNNASSTGSVVQTGGLVNVNRWLVLGIGATYDGLTLPTATYSISGGELRMSGTGTQIEVASSGPGSVGVLNISGGSVRLFNNQSIALGVHTGAFEGTVNQSGGTVTFYSDAGTTIGGTGSLSIGQAAAPGLPGIDDNPAYAYNLTGGTLIVPAVTHNTTAGNPSTATLNLGDGTLQAAKANTTFVQNLTHLYTQNSPIRHGGTIDDGGFAVTIPMVIESDPSSPGGGITKQGSGTLTLSANNTYTGPTNIIAGSLVPTGSINSSSAINVGSATAANAKIDNPNTSITAPVVLTTNGKVDGTGSYSSVTVGNSATNVVTHGDGTATALNIGSLTFNGTGHLSVNATGGTPGINVSSLAALGGSGSVLVDASNTSWTIGQAYNLVSYGSLTNGAGFTTGTITGLAARETGSIVASGGFLSLVIGGDTPIWTGAVNSNWDTSTQNFKLTTAGTPTAFLPTDLVTFDDSASNTSVAIATAVSPTASVFNNATKTYTLSGAAGIAAGSFTKNNTGTVILTNANTYTGPTTVNGGILNLQNAAAIAAASTTTVNAGGALELQGGITTAAFPVALNGGTLRNVSGANTYAGLLSLPGSGTIESASTGITLSNTGSILGSGQLTLTGAGDGNIASALGNSGGLVKNGAGTWTLSKASVATFAGGATVNAGTLKLALGGGTSPIRGALTVNNGGTVVTTAGDAIGFTVGSQISTITVNSGGLLDNLTTGNEAFATNFVLNGGTVQATGTAVAPAAANGGRYNFDNGFGISTTASGVTSTFAGGITLRGTSITYDITGGSTLNQTGGVFGGTGGIIKNGAGTLNLAAANGQGGGVTVNAGTLIASNAGAINGGQLTVNDGAATKIATAIATPVAVSSLTLGGSAYVDITSGALKIVYGSTTDPASTVQGQLAAAYASGFATGALRTSTGSAKVGLGWNDDTASQTLTIARTLYGDATLDGAVNFSDLLALAKNYNTSGKAWSQGDFNYDGNVNFSDLLTLAKVYNQTLSADQSSEVGNLFAADFALAQTLAPEPATLSALGLTAALGLRRRRRHSPAASQASMN